MQTIQKELYQQYPDNIIYDILNNKKTQIRAIIDPQPKIYRKLNGKGYYSKQWEENKGTYTLYLEAWPVHGTWGKASDTIICPHDIDDVLLIKTKNESYPHISSPIATVKINSIKIEQLNMINDGDVAHEGISWNEPLGTARGKGNSPAQREYCRYWNSIYGPDAWDKNPWVWVINFEHI